MGLERKFTDVKAALGSVRGVCSETLCPGTAHLSGAFPLKPKAVHMDAYKIFTEYS